MQGITFDFLKDNTTNIDDGIYEKFDKDGTDTDIIPIHQIIAGPLNVISIPSTFYRSKRRVKVPDNRAIHKLLFARKWWRLINLVSFLLLLKIGFFWIEQNCLHWN